MKIVTASLKNNYITDIHMRHHDLTSDEPETAGGDDTGPNPYDLLMASLASCTAMTMRWYAEREGIDLRGCEVTLKYNRIHIEDCKSCAEGDPRSHIDHIICEVEFSGDMSDEQKEKMLSIPPKCPVSRTLKSGAVIEHEIEYV